MAWGPCPDQACGVSAFLQPGTPGAQGRPADLPRARTWSLARLRSGHVRSRGGLTAPRRLGSGASPLPAAAVSAPHPAPPRATHRGWGLLGRGRRGRGSGKEGGGGGGGGDSEDPHLTTTCSVQPWLEATPRGARPLCPLTSLPGFWGRDRSGLRPRATCPRPPAPVGSCPNSRTSLPLQSRRAELIPPPACAPAHLETA